MPIHTIGDANVLWPREMTGAQCRALLRRVFFEANYCSKSQIADTADFGPDGRRKRLPAAAISVQEITLRSGVTFSASRWSPMAFAMKRAVIGVPS